MQPYVYCVTKYDPRDRDEQGRYIGDEDVYSDHGRVEDAYLSAVASFAAEAGVTELEIREPGITGFVNFGVEATIEGQGLAGLFPADLTGYHDGASVSLATALELIRAMLRDNGAWCRLETRGGFFVHVGYDQYLYIGSAQPCRRAVARARDLGLFPERIDGSPYDPAIDAPDEIRAADAEFWGELSDLAGAHGAVLLEEGHLANHSRWHRLTVTDVDAVRARLAPRARLLVWPELLGDVEAMLRSLPDEGLVEMVWEDARGTITSRVVDDELFGELPALLTGARAAMVLSGSADDRHPLLTAVLPDADGVLRARWAP